MDVLTRASGIGKKMAEQIILSLKDKVSKLEMTQTYMVDIASPNGGASESENNPQIVKDTLEALESLGYKDKEVHKLVRTHLSSEIKSSEELIKIVLKEL